MKKVYNELKKTLNLVGWIDISNSGEVGFDFQKNKTDIHWACEITVLDCRKVALVMSFTRITSNPEEKKSGHLEFEKLYIKQKYH